MPVRFFVISLAIFVAPFAAQADVCSALRSKVSGYYSTPVGDPDGEHYGRFTYKDAAGENAWIYCPTAYRDTKGLTVWWYGGRPPRDFTSKAASVAAGIFGIPRREVFDVVDRCLVAARNDARGNGTGALKGFTLLCGYNEDSESNLIFNERRQRIAMIGKMWMDGKLKLLAGSLGGSAAETPRASVSDADTLVAALLRVQR